MKNKIIPILISLFVFVGIVSVTTYSFFQLTESASETKATVTVEFNIAELVAALLGGSGLAALGFGYAAKQLAGKEK